MLVKNLGITLSTKNSEIEIDDFFKTLSANNAEYKLRRGGHRKIYISQDNDYTYGLNLTIKNSRTYTSLVEEDKEFVVKVSDLENKLMEFNLFIISHKNGCGLYQYYHNSCSPGSFGSNLITLYRAELEQRRKKELEALYNLPSFRKKQEKAIKSKYHKGLEFSLMVQSRDLQSLLDKYKQIKTLKYDISSIDTIIKPGEPLSGLVKKVKHTVKFDTTVDKNLIIAGIEQLLPSVDPNTASFEVLDDEDEATSVKMADVPESFGEYDYSDFTMKLIDLKVNDLKNFSIMEDLKNKCEVQYRNIFQKKTEGES